MVKGKSGDPELSTSTENPGTRPKTLSLTAWILINELKRYEKLKKVRVRPIEKLKHIKKKKKLANNYMVGMIFSGIDTTLDIFS